MNRKKMILLTSLLTLLPMLLGLLLWNRLPEEMPIHFNSHGEVDDWGSKAFVVFFLPLFLFVMHLITGFITLHDPKKQNIGDKIFLLILFYMLLAFALASLVEPDILILDEVLSAGGIQMEVNRDELYYMQPKIENINSLLGQPAGSNIIPLEQAGSLTLNGV